jgi:predicted RNase H-like nuclease (RuvC/YqgF family)
MTHTESLAQGGADLAREASNRSTGEAKPTEFCEARALLEKAMQALEVRFRASEQSLAAAQARLESQTQEFSVQQAAIADLKNEVTSREAQLETLAASLARARAAMEQERNLRLAAEQRASNLEDVRKSLECQLSRQAQMRQQLLNERRDERGFGVRQLSAALTPLVGAGNQ